MSTIEIFNAKSPHKAPLVSIDSVSNEESITSLKKRISKAIGLDVNRIALRAEPKGKAIKDEELVKNLNLPDKNAQLFLRDLGPQIAWKTVFLSEYAGPLFVYPIFYLRPSFIYGSSNIQQRPIELAVTIALICHSIHYMKRLYETQFVHRFSNGTMPFTNLFKNCTYYWGFAAFMSYFINHPLYSKPMFGDAQVILGLLAFVLCEFGNYSIHILLRDLRPPGTKERKIPYPNSNPLTVLYNYVSCPNYTYEICSWLSFAWIVQSLPVILFTMAGFIQMKIWAAGKHRAYKKEFTNYPKGRTPIIPFIC